MISTDNKHFFKATNLMMAKLLILAKAWINS